VTAQSVTLVEGDLLGHEFGPARFDLIYSIGVLAEHAPLDERIVSHVAGWLRPRGRFAFTTVHPESPSIPATVGRRLGRRLWPVAPGRIRTLIRARLLSESLYADEARVRELLAAGFEIEALERFQSEAHLHCLCVATKRAA
jgi:SAM-dependent methyltransferase